MAEVLLASLRAVDALVATQRLSTDALVEAWKTPKHFSVGRDAHEYLLNATRRRTTAPLFEEALTGRLGAVVLAWAEANANDDSTFFAPLFEAAEEALQPPSVLGRAARERVRGGPPLDALASLPFAGRISWLDDDDRTAARVDLCLWWAGGDARSVPRLARFVFEHASAFERFVVRRSSGELLDRVLAARTLVVAANGYEPTRAQRGVFKVLRQLVQHAEPRVWIPTAVALGRLAGKSAEVRTWLFRWVESDHLGERRRATCALASMPGPDSWWIESHVDTLIDADDPWALAALGPAIPHLLGARRALWDTFAKRLGEEDKPELWWSATLGLVSARRLGVLDRTGTNLLAEARRRALEPPTAVTDAMLWHDVARATDFIDGLEVAPTDVDRGLDRLVDAALRTDPERVASRTKALATVVRGTFDAIRETDRPDDPGAMAERLAGAESCASAAAIGLWRPLLRAAGEEPEPVDRGALLQHIARVASDTLDVEAPSFTLHRTALRILGAYLDAAPTGDAIRTVLRAIERPAWLREPKRRTRSRFKKPLGELVARIVGAARPGSRSGDGRAYRRFLAWWCFAAASPEAVTFLARAEAAAADGIGRAARRHADALRAAIASGHQAENGTWRPRVEHELAALDASDTALYDTVVAIAAGLAAAEAARRQDDDTRLRLAVIELGEAAATLSALLADPARALADDAEIAWTSDDVRDLVATTVAAFENEPNDPDEIERRWAETGGPLLGPVLSHAVRACLRASRRTPSSWGNDRTMRQIGPYRLEAHLGGGAQGEVWRVVREPVGRWFVMKLLPTRAAMMGTLEQRQMRDALASEAELLKRMYHPNVANFVDAGWSDDQPYLVLEWLLGCGLDEYLTAKPLTLAELRPIVEDVVNGLLAMHAMGLVHCDLKPGNVFLRLPLPPQTPRFDPNLHRDPTTTPMLGAVVIDFGVARTLASAGASLEVVSGTPGYLAPEQTRGEVHPNTDVYALAGTVYRALTGHTFFEGIQALGARLVAHQSRRPFEDPATRDALSAVAPAALVSLLDEATAMSPEERPNIETFQARFAEI